MHITVHNFMQNFGTIGARLVELQSENFYLHGGKLNCVYMVANIYNILNISSD